MTPDQIEEWLAGHLHRFDQPNQFLGTEPNAERRPWETASVRWLIAAAWPYFHSAGNQSVPAVYQAIHQASPAFLCDLSYLPETPRDLRMLEAGQVPVFGIESKHQARDFDVVATSISYAVLFMNFCKTLSTSGIPLRWRDREAQGLEQFPMVMVGGQAYCAPGAMEPVVDCVWLGEVEDEPGNGGIGLVCSRIGQFKAEGLWHADRLECYRRLAREFNYLYFPRFVDVEYYYAERGLEHPSKQVAGYRSLLPGMRMPFRARHVIDLDKITPLLSAPLLFSNPSMGAGDLEVARGCPAWCSFCRLSWVTKPYRQRGVAQSVEHAKAWQLAMGSVEMSPFGPDFPMHTRKLDLLSRLLQEVNDSVDDTALRVDDFIADSRYILLQAHGGAVAVTLGVEGASQRMRDLVGKGCSDDDVVQAVIQGIRAGFRKFKLFMINNLPGEDEGDVLRAIELARRLAAVRDELGQPNVLIQFSFTPLLIEAQTPFQWFAPTPPDHTYIQVADALRDLRIQFKLGTKAQPDKVAFFQLCQRASREVGEAIVDVLEHFGTACWGGVPKGEGGMRDRLEAALKDHGFANGFADCFDERGAADLFGWEFIDTGASVQVMLDTYRQMVEFLQGTDSRTYDELVPPASHGNEWVARCDRGCEGARCGACAPADYHKRREYIGLAAGEPDIDLGAIRSVDQTSVACKVRAQLNVPERYRHVTNAHWRYNVRRAAYRAADAVGSQFGIAKHSIRFASDAITQRDGSYGFDYVEFGLTRMPGVRLPLFMSRMQAELAPWVRLQGWELLPARAEMPKGPLAHYELEVEASSEELAARLREWEQASYVKLILHGDSSYFGLAAEEVNAKDLVHGIWVVRQGHRHLLRMMLSGKAGPYQVAAAFLGRSSWLEYAMHPALRLDWYAPVPGGGLLAPECLGCGSPVPDRLLRGQQPEWCPRCEAHLASDGEVFLLAETALR